MRHLSTLASTSYPSPPSPAPAAAASQCQRLCLVHGHPVLVATVIVVILRHLHALCRLGRRCDGKRASSSWPSERAPLLGLGDRPMAVLLVCTRKTRRPTWISAWLQMSEMKYTLCCFLRIERNQDRGKVKS